MALLVGPRARGDGRCVPGAIARYQLTIADYHNTYYGRLAEKLLEKQGAPLGAEQLVFAQTRVAARPAKTIIFRRPKSTIRTLLALGLYEPAVKELEFARAKWGDSPGYHRDARVGEQADGGIGIGHASSSRWRAARSR